MNNDLNKEGCWTYELYDIPSFMCAGKSRAGKTIQVGEDGIFKFVDFPTSVSWANITGNNPEANAVLKQYLENKYCLESFAVELDGRLEDVEEVIPSLATSENKLVSKSELDYAIQTAEATYRGQFDTKALLDAYTGDKDKNDTAIVIADETHSGATYKYQWSEENETWQALYKISDSPLTPAQVSALNSGITASDVAKMLKTPVSTPTELLLTGVDTTNSQAMYKIDTETMEITGSTSPYTIKAKATGGETHLYQHSIEITYVNGSIVSFVITNNSQSIPTTRDDFIDYLVELSGNNNKYKLVSANISKTQSNILTIYIANGEGAYWTYSDGIIINKGYSISGTTIAEFEYPITYWSNGLIDTITINSYQLF